MDTAKLFAPKTVANLATVYVLWGSTYLAIRIAVTTWPPFSLGVVRFIIAGFLMLMVSKMMGQSTKLDKESLITCLISGLLLFPIGNGAVNWAEQTTSSGVVATTIATTPMWMTLIAWFMGTGPRPTARVAAALGIGLVGVALLVSNGRAVVTPLNAVVVLTGAFVWSFASVWMAKRKPSGSILVRSGYQMLAGAVGFALLAIAHGEYRAFTPALLKPTPLLSVAYLVVFGSCFGYVAFSWLVNNLPAHVAGTYAFVNPVVAVVLGSLFGERVTVRACLAIVLIVIGVALSVLSTSSTTAPSSRATGGSSLKS